MDKEKRDQEGGEGGAGRSKRRGGDQKKTQNHHLTAKEQASPADGEKSKFHADRLNSKNIVKTLVLTA